MELIRKNIHMDRIRARALSQFALEDDLNVPDQKPDVNAIHFEKGAVVVDEIRAGTNCVNVRGRLLFWLLYHTKEGGSGLVRLEGKIPFEEKINAEGITSKDEVMAEGEIEDLSISLINSRKLNIKAVVTINSWAEELYDIEAPIGIYADEEVQYCKTPVDLVQMAVRKKDIFRIREEVTLPANYPNVFQILWSDISPADMDFRVMNDKITLSGEIRLFVLYEGEGEESPIRTFEYTLPVSGSIDCHGCKEGMIPDIQCRKSITEPGQSELSIRPDFDGEERNLALDLVLDVDMKLYEEECVELLTSLYGVTKEVEAVTQSGMIRKLLAKVNGKTRVSERIRVKTGGNGILQLLHSEGKVFVEEQEMGEDCVHLNGILQLHLIYITGNDESPYGAATVQIPYEYTLEVPGIGAGEAGMEQAKTGKMRESGIGTGRETIPVRAEAEQLQVTMSDSEEMDVKAVLDFSTIAFANKELPLISQVQVKDLDPKTLAELPGIAIYVVKPGDHLWSIGKKYYVPVDRIRKMNGLESDVLLPGQKLLIVKGM